MAIPPDVHLEQYVPCRVDRGGVQPDLLIIHSTQSYVLWSSDRELVATVEEFTKDNSTRSAHLIVHVDGMWVYCVPWEWGACGAEYLNPRAFHIELVQQTPDIPFTRAQIERAAEASLWICNLWGIPRQRILDENQAGIIGHEDTLQGQSHNKTDPGPLFPWGAFVEMLNPPGPPPPQPPGGEGARLPLAIVGLAAVAVGGSLLIQELQRRER